MLLGCFGRLIFDLSSESAFVAREASMYALEVSTEDSTDESSVQNLDDSLETSFTELK